LDTPFLELGGDSLTGFIIIAEIENMFQVSINPETLYEFNTIRKMAGYIEQNRP